VAQRKAAIATILFSLLCVAENCIYATTILPQ
jgi:hypothetical protein